MPAAQHIAHVPDEAQFDVGVLFVHGIGNQAPAQTLTTWGEALHQWFSATGTLELVDGYSGSGEDPSWSWLRWHGRDDDDVSVLMVEGYWADLAPQPSLVSMLRWSLNVLPVTVWSHFAQSMSNRQTIRRQSHGFRKWIETVWLILALILLPISAVVLIPLSIAFFFIIAALGLVGFAIPSVGESARAVQRAIEQSLGDVLALDAHPLRAQFIVSRVSRHLQVLAATVGTDANLVVVAHSQGTEVVLRVLEVTAPEHPVRLVTFGQAITKIRTLGHSKASRYGPLLFPALFVLLAIGYFDDRDQILPVIVGAVRFSLFMIGMIFAGLTALWLLTTAGSFLRRHGLPVDRAKAVFDGLGALPWVAVWAGGWWTTDDLVWPLTLWTLIGDTMVGGGDAAGLGGILAFALVGASLPFIDPPAVLAVDPPPSVASWWDVHASADPVPNSRSPFDDGDRSWSIKTWNRGNFVTDHTTYWRNLDHFVSLVACAILGKDREWIVANADFDEVGSGRLAAMKGLWRRRVVAVLAGVGLVLWLGADVLDSPISSISTDWEGSPGWADWLGRQLQDVGDVVVAVAAAVLLYAGLSWLWSQAESKRYEEYFDQVSEKV